VPKVLIEKCDTSEKAVWTALAFENTFLRGCRPPNFSFLIRYSNADTLPRLADDLRHIKDPRLALLASLELTVEGQYASFLDAVLRDHKFSKSEIASILPEVCRLARESKLVRERLSQMKLDAPELSPESLHELENTNLFILLPEDKVR
jgi:hypothetical protein